MLALKIFQNYLGLQILFLDKFAHLKATKNSKAEEIFKLLEQNIDSTKYPIEKIENYEPIKARSFLDKTGLEELARELGSFRWLGMGQAFSVVHELQRLIELETKGLVRTNLYYSEKSSPGLGCHKDNRDILVFQISGEKKWTLKGHGDVLLRPGDILIIPKGIEHQAVTDSKSVHLTFSMEPLSLETLVLNSNSLRPLKLDTIGKKVDLSSEQVELALEEYKNNFCLQRASGLTKVKNEEIEFSSGDFAINTLNILWLDESDDGVALVTKNAENQLKEIILKDTGKAIFSECWMSSHFNLKTIRDYDLAVSLNTLKTLWKSGLIIRR